MSVEVNNILLAGVGGQGILLASEVLAEVLMNAGFDVKKNEIHGMSQRGGSVISHVRYGKWVHSSIIPAGEVDLLFGFELLETYRYLPLLREGGRVLANSLKIFPPGVLLGKEHYPENIPARIAAHVADFRLVDGLELAMRAGDARTVNTVLLGALSNGLPFAAEAWLTALEQRVPAKALEANRRAFALGRDEQDETAKGRV